MAKRPGKARSWAQGEKTAAKRFFKRLGTRQERQALDEETRQRAAEAGRAMPPEGDTRDQT